MSSMTKSLANRNRTSDRWMSLIWVMSLIICGTCPNCCEAFNYSPPLYQLSYHEDMSYGQHFKIGPTVSISQFISIFISNNVMFPFIATNSYHH